MKKKSFTTILGGLLVVIGASSLQATGAAAEQPRNWGVSYQNNNCEAKTDAPSPDPNETERYEITLGYANRSQSKLYLSVKVPKMGPDGFTYQDARKKGFTAWIIVDGQQFEARTVSLINGTFTFPVDNSTPLQTALSSAKSIAGVWRGPNAGDPVNMGFELAYIPQAISWLASCAELGAAALPNAPTSTQVIANNGVQVVAADDNCPYNNQPPNVRAISCKDWANAVARQQDAARQREQRNARQQKAIEAYNTAQGQMNASERKQLHDCVYGPTNGDDFRAVMGMDVVVSQCTDKTLAERKRNDEVRGEEEAQRAAEDAPPPPPQWGQTGPRYADATSNFILDSDGNKVCVSWSCDGAKSATIQNDIDLTKVNLGDTIWVTGEGMPLSEWRKLHRDDGMGSNALTRVIVLHADGWISCTRAGEKWDFENRAASGGREEWKAHYAVKPGSIHVSKGNGNILLACVGVGPAALQISAATFDTKGLPAPSYCANRLLLSDGGYNGNSYDHPTYCQVTPAIADQMLEWMRKVPLNH